MKPKKILASLDMYRKVPADLLEGTKRGSVISFMSLLTMITLIFLETKSYFQTQLVTELKLDSSTKETQIRANFNITMMDLKCDFIHLDAVSVLGTEQSVNQHIHKRSIDGDGVRKYYSARNKRQRDIVMYDKTVTETIEELTKDGEDVVSLTPEFFEEALKEHRFVFVDHYAGYVSCLLCRRVKKNGLSRFSHRFFFPIVSSFDRWCSHCRDLAPTWEKLAKIMNTASVEIARQRLKELHEELELQLSDVEEWSAEKLKHAEGGVKLPVLIAKVDCVEHHDFCRNQNVAAYPTLRLFVDGEQYGGDYYGDRTVLDFTDYLATVEEQYLEEKGDVSQAHIIAARLRKDHIMEFMAPYDDDEERYYRETPDETIRRLPAFYENKIHKEWIQKDHPGCEVSGVLMLDHVPGNFHIFARSETHDLAPQLTNLSHQINSLSFGEPFAHRRLETGRVTDVPPGLASKVHPMDGNVYINTNFHEAYHHYLKLVTTNYTESGIYGNKKESRVYQMLHQSQLTFYKSDVVPVAKFQYDFSPVAMTYRVKKRKWYEYITSLLAIVGGMFTVIGMFERILCVVSKKKKLVQHQHSKPY